MRHLAQISQHVFPGNILPQYESQVGFAIPEFPALKNGFETDGGYGFIGHFDTDEGLPRNRRFDPDRLSGQRQRQIIGERRDARKLHSESRPERILRHGRPHPHFSRLNRDAEIFERALDDMLVALRIPAHRLTRSGFHEIHRRQFPAHRTPPGFARTDKGRHQNRIILSSGFLQTFRSFSVFLKSDIADIIGFQTCVLRQRSSYFGRNNFALGFWSRIIHRHFSFRHFLLWFPSPFLLQTFKRTDERNIERGNHPHGKERDKNNRAGRFTGKIAQHIRETEADEAATLSGARHLQ